MVYMNQEKKAKITDTKIKKICKKYADPNNMDGDFDSAKAIAEKKADEDFKNYVRMLAI